jgi:hypothetical protein
MTNAELEEQIKEAIEMLRGLRVELDATDDEYAVSLIMDDIRWWEKEYDTLIKLRIS